MLTSSSLRADESIGSEDRVIQQTPVAGQSFLKGNELQSQTILENEASNSNSPRELPMTEDANLHTPLASYGSAEGPVGWEVQTIDNQRFDVKGQNESELRYNKRTPNLDRIAKFFKDNKTSGDGSLLKRFNMSEDEDTPLSRRDKDSPTNLEFEPSAPVFKLDYKDSLDGIKIATGNENAKDDTLDYSPTRFKSNVIGFVKTRPEGFSPDRSEVPSPSDEFESKSLHRSEKPLVLTGENYSQSLSHESKGKESKMYMGKAKEEQRKIGESPNVSKISNSDCFGPEVMEDESVDFSRIDDTAEGIPEMWVLRPNNAGVFNSNRSTQIINTTEAHVDTKNSFSRANDADNASFIKEPNEMPTQVITSQCDVIQGRNDADTELINGEIGSSTQIIRSPEQMMLHSLETPRVFPRISLEPNMEVPETSSPSKSREAIMERNSSPSPAERDNGRTGHATQVDDIEERVRLRIPSKPDSLCSRDVESQPETLTGRPDTVVVLSDAELTQELPEIEEDVDQQSSSLFDEMDQKQTSGEFNSKRRKRHEAQTVELAAEDESRSVKPSPTKKVCPNSRSKRSISRDRSGGDDMNEFEEAEHRNRKFGRSSDTMIQSLEKSKQNDLPGELRSRDDDYLSKEDIKFEDAVWCQYSLDYRYYPGRILGYEEQPDSYWVYFETGKSLTKNEDIYYLDIRVGDTVTFAGKKYQVVGLEAKYTDEATIRCVRGYDTVHLKRKKKSGSLGQKTIIKPLASTCLDLNEWTKRPKIILENGFHTKAKAYQALQHPIRGRKSNATSSPRKVKSAFREHTIKPVYKEESDDETSLVEQREAANARGSLDSVLKRLQSSERMKNGQSKIFENCVFVLTGLDEDRQAFSDAIEGQGGEILQLGFSELFEYERLEDNAIDFTRYALQLEWKRRTSESNYRFACLITRRHLRSLKYLETLALGWPTLHWKFIRECLRRGKLCLEAIHHYLLPSGESYRLSFEPSTKNGVIKSNNIFQYYLKLSQGLMLRSQMHAMRDQMKDYVVVLYGQSELDHFIRFALACLGVTELYHIHGKSNIPSQEEIDQLNAELDLLISDSVSRVVIYVNKSSGVSSTLLEDMRRQISSKHRKHPEQDLEIHIEAKEWLIQTIINGSPGFHE